MKYFLTIGSLFFLILIGHPKNVSADVLWSADHEIGNLNQWYYPATEQGGKVQGGGEYNSGSGDTIISSDVAHWGKFSAKMTINTDGTSSQATRLFQWAMAQNYPSAYYSVWYYFPQNYKPKLYWNIFQFKTKKFDGSANDPTWTVNVDNKKESGEMFLYLYDQLNRKDYSKQLKAVNIPVNKWVHLEAYLKQSDNKKGQLTLWQDGVKIYDLKRITTKYKNADNQWSVNNYSNDITPSYVLIYIDDAVISTTRIGTGK